MPTAPPRVCNRCHKPAPKGRLCSCRPAFEGSTHVGGHDDRRMQRSIESYRGGHPYCEWPGCHRVMHQVDHIVPLAEGGDRYSHLNMQSLCADHHKTKTVADARRGKTRAR